MPPSSKIWTIFLWASATASPGLMRLAMTLETTNAPATIIDDARRHGDHGCEPPGQADSALDRYAYGPGGRVVVCYRAQADTQPRTKEQHERKKKNDSNRRSDQMNAADENSAHEERIVTHAEFNRARGAAPDRQRRAAQEDVDAERHHKNHHNRSAREPAQRNPLNAYPETKHDNRGQ